MDSCDPESEALIWKLHRELNGLTRSSRRGAALVSLDTQKRESRSNTTRKGKAQPASSQQEQHNDPLKRKASAINDEPANQPPAKIPRTEQTVDVPAAKPVLQKPPPLAPQVAEAIPIVTHEPSPAPSRPEPAHRDSPPVPHATPPVPSISPIVSAAISAGQRVREEAKTRNLDDTGQRVIKCFYAGIRWGIPLKPADLQSRAELATALNDALAGEILSCGRGDILHVVFLDSDGSISEFPSLRGAGTSTKESLQKWQAAVENAVKVYVRRT